MVKKEIKSYIEQAIRKLPITGEAGNAKYYLKKAITLLDQPEPLQEVKISPVKKVVPINEQYNFQPMSSIVGAKKVVNGLDVMIEQEKIKLENIKNRKKKPIKNEDVEQFFG